MNPSSRRRFLCQSAVVVGLGSLSTSAWAAEASDAEVPFARITCDGRYPGHLQGICIDDAGHLYWPFTTELVKTDAQGKIVKKIPVASHHGDLCFADGKIYVAVNLGQFNKPAGSADSWVYVYDAETLKELDRVATPEVVHGAGGMDVG